MSLTPALCRAARALLDWSQSRLAEESHVATKTIADFERGQRVPYDRTLADIQSTLESVGIIFVAENGEGAGIRMRKFTEGDIVRAAKAGHISGITIEKGQTGIVTRVEIATENLGSKYRVTVRFGDIPIPISAKDIELVQRASSGARRKPNA